MLEDIKNLGLAEALQLIVNHGLAHDLIYITLGTLDALCLDEVVDIGTLLLILLLINGDESQTSLEPKIIVINIREENLVVVGWVDVGNFKFTRYIDCIMLSMMLASASVKERASTTYCSFTSFSLPSS